MKRETQDYPFAVLGDNPLELNRDGKDLLGFSTFVEPFALRIKSSRSQTPFTVAVFGPWGQGKSSLMKLLQQALERHPENQGKLDNSVHCVWFEPWKYHSREEVWQGLALTLVQQVRKNTTLAKELKRKRGPVTKVVAKGLWGTFMGKWGKELVEAVAREPWSPAHLHLFEEQLQSLFDYLKPEEGKENGKLLVLFVDDLDRCLPEPAVAVLEALKLVLSRPGLVIVMGIAEREFYRVVEDIYTQSRAGSGDRIREDWGKDYLRKIVQIPFHLPKVTDRDFHGYVRQCLADSGVDRALQETAWRPVLPREPAGGQALLEPFHRRLGQGRGQRRAQRRPGGRQGGTRAGGLRAGRRRSGRWLHRALPGRWIQCLPALPGQLPRKGAAQRYLGRTRGG